MTINAMIDACMRCTVCGLPPSARCRCHEPKDPVVLRCERCHATTVVERELDFFDFDEIATLCPECSEEKP